MEENNRKGPGVFYAVVGVATLVVAIIGATFAYFSASTSGNSSDIQGRTLNITDADLELTVSRVLFTGATVNTNLAPAFIGSTGIANPDALTAAQLQAMLTAKCEEANKYTGCHVWKVDAWNKSTTDAIQHANLWLNLNVTPVDTTDGDTAQWGYAVFTATDTETGTAPNVTHALSGAQFAVVPSGEGLRANHDDLGTAVAGKTLDMHNDATIAADGHAIYYVMVYLNDDDLVQNATNPSDETPTSTDERASYNGSVLFEAMGGKVRATFTVA